MESTHRGACTGTVLKDIKKYKLGNPKTYHYLNQSNFFELQGLNESKEYLATRRAMEVVGMSSDEQAKFVYNWESLGANSKKETPLLRAKLSWLC